MVKSASSLTAGRGSMHTAHQALSHVVGVATRRPLRKGDRSES